MEDRLLIIAGQRVDLPDSVTFNLVWQCAESGEVKIYGSGSTTIRLPFTPQNDNVFGGAKYLTALGGKEFQTFTGCSYYERGVQLIDGGTAYITGISGGYDICLTWGNTDYVQRLKDTGVAQLEGETFKWDNSVFYPYAETSKSPDILPTLYMDNGTPKFRHYMSRPTYNYTKILETVGIGSGNTPKSVYDFIGKVHIQPNSTQARGRYTLPLHTENILIRLERKISGAWLLAEFDIPQQETYTVKVGNGFDMITLALMRNNDLYREITYKGALAYCFYVTAQDPTPFGKYRYGIGRNGGFAKAFVQDGTQSTYAPMYRAEIEQYSRGEGTLTGTAVQKPVLIGYSDEADEDDASYVTLHSPDNANTKEVVLSAGKYYLMACMKSALSEDESLFDTGMLSIVKNTLRIEGQNALMSFVESVSGQSYTKIETPNDEVLFTAPPKVVQMLGYSTAYDIVEDFAKMFQLMITVRNGEAQYFNFGTLLDNKESAYDWSGAFVSLDKVTIGNSKVGLENTADFASYEGYIGKRASGRFYTDTGRGKGGEFVRLGSIGSYDTTVQFGTQTVPNIPLSEVEVKKNGNTTEYSTKITDKPAMFFVHETLTLVTITGEDGKTYRTNGAIPVKGGTFQQIIDNYWSDFVRVVSRQKTVNITLNISPSALYGFDFRRPVYIRQLSVYLFAQKITYKGGMKAELQGIVLPMTKMAEDPDDGALVDATDTYIVDSADTYVVDSTQY